MLRPTQHPRPLNPARRAFTLMEAALATVIIGVGVLAVVEAQQAFLRKNQWSTHTSTAMFLANEVREMTRNLPRHDPFAGGIYFENPVSHTGFRGWGPNVTELLVTDFNDLDDFDGMVFGNAPNLPGPITRRYTGPIDAFGEIIPQTSWRGDVLLDADNNIVPLEGWTQYVKVDKVDPADFTVVRAREYYEPAVGTTPELEVHRFPLRVTVTILYQGPADLEARVISSVSWVVPAI
jgi:hypothetical protein